MKIYDTDAAAMIYIQKSRVAQFFFVKVSDFFYTFSNSAPVFLSDWFSAVKYFARFTSIMQSTSWESLLYNDLKKIFEKNI